MRDGSTRTLRATRWIARLPRLALVLACVVLSAAGLRSIARPSEARQPSRAAVVVRDAGVESVAENFTRVYLTWNGQAPAGQTDNVEAPVVPAGVKQRVIWTSVARVERAGPNWTVTVAAGTTRGNYDVAVPVMRDTSGVLAVVSEPAIVGSVPMTRRARAVTERDVDDSALAAVAKRALRNYLEGDRSDLVADLGDDAAVVLPDPRLRLLSIDRLTWATPTSRVAALVRVRVAGGVELTLRYELAVIRRAGRWLVRAIHTNAKPEVHP